MTTPAETPRRRLIDAYTGEHAIYGIVLVTSLIAVAAHEETDLDVIILVFGTVLAFWVAHVYAAVIASRATRPWPPLRVSILAGIRHSIGMVIATLPPIALLATGVLGWVDEETAYVAALVSGVVLLAIIGYDNAARNGSSWVSRIVGVLTTVLIGTFVIALSVLTH